MLKIAFVVSVCPIAAIRNDAERSTTSASRSSLQESWRGWRVDAQSYGWATARNGGLHSGRC
jgi:3-methyladenine DNA glycosylase/8-oxoguanine DNA glycosylase